MWLASENLSSSDNISSSCSPDHVKKGAKILLAIENWMLRHNHYKLQYMNHHTKAIVADAEVGLFLIQDLWQDFLLMCPVTSGSSISSWWRLYLSEKLMCKRKKIEEPLTPYKKCNPADSEFILSQKKKIFFICNYTDPIAKAYGRNYSGNVLLSHFTARSLDFF